MVSKLKSITSNKKLMVVVCIAFAVIVGVVLYLCLHDDNNYYTTLSKEAGQTTGSFRYVLDVRTSDHKDGNIDLGDYMGANGDNANSKSDYDEIKDLEKQDMSSLDTKDNNVEPSKSTEWKASGNGSTADWQFPNYEIVLSGRVESTDPLTATMTVSATTPYRSSEMFDITVIDGDFYMNMMTLRKWLQASEFTDLSSLASSIPENAVYLKVAEDKVSFVSSFAEDGAKNSGCVGVSNFYNRVIAFKSVCVQVMQGSFGDLGLGKSSDRYTLQVSSEEAVSKFISSFKGLISNAGNYYANYVDLLAKKEYISDDEKTQLLVERSNFVSSLSGLWAKIGSMSADDIKALNLQVSSWATQYENSSKSVVHEADWGMSYTLDSVDYVVTLYGCVTSLGENDVKVTVPDGATCTLEQLGNCDVNNIMSNIVSFFNVTDFSMKNNKGEGVDAVAISYKYALIKDLNELNSGSAGFVKLSRYTIDAFVSKYATMTALDLGSSKFDITNYVRIRDYVKQLDSLYGATKEGVSDNNMSDASLDNNGVKLSLTPVAVDDIAGKSVLVYQLDISNESSNRVSYNFTKWKLSSDNKALSVNNMDELKSLKHDLYEDNIETIVDLNAGDKFDCLLYMVLDDDLSNSWHLEADGFKTSDILVSKQSEVVSNEIGLSDKDSSEKSDNSSALSEG